MGQRPVHSFAPAHLFSRDDGGDDEEGEVEEVEVDDYEDDGEDEDLGKINHGDRL